MSLDWCSLSHYPKQSHVLCSRDGFPGGVRGVHTPLALARWGAGGCAIFMIKQKNRRHNEIHVIVMICHTVSEYHE